MRERTIRIRLSALPLRQKLVAGCIAVAIGSGLLVWSRYAAPPATTAVLSFDADQAGTGAMNANAKEPAVALAQSILSDEAVRGLAKQASVSFPRGKNEVVEFRSRLDMAQASPGLLHVNYRDTDKKVSAGVANAVANTLVAWMPAPAVASADSALARQGGPIAKHASAKSRHQRYSLHSRSPALRELESQLAAADRKIAALNAQAIASQTPDADANETDQLRLQRAQLMQAIGVEKRREALRDKTASGVADSANPGAGQIWQRPFTLVRLAGDAGVSQSESGLFWYWPLAVILCGLLYLARAISRYWPMESAAPAPAEPPMLNNQLRAENASEYAGSFTQIEDHWTREVLKSLSLTDLGQEVEVFATRHEQLAVDGGQVDHCVPGLQERAHHDEVQTRR
jgi:hypothetical protein